MSVVNGEGTGAVRQVIFPLAVVATAQLLAYIRYGYAQKYSHVLSASLPLQRHSNTRLPCDRATAHEAAGRSKADVFRCDTLRIDTLSTRELLSQTDAVPFRTRMMSLDRYNLFYDLPPS